jgi:outer membrane protein assembly factor BamB
MRFTGTCLFFLLSLAVSAVLAENMPAPSASATSWPVCRGDAQATGIARTTLSDKPELLWKITKDKATFETTPAIANGLVLLGDMNESLLALKLDTGEKVWEQSGKLGFPGSPAIRDNLVYVGDGDGIFHCYELTTGKELWKFPTEGEIVAGANFWNEFVLVGSQDSRMYALHGTSGELKWKLQIENQIRTTITYAEDKAFVAQCDGKIHIVDLHTGKITASVPLEQPNTTSSPAVLGDNLFFGTEEGTVMAVDWKQAKISWAVSDNTRSQPYRSSPAVNKDYIVIGSRGKRVQSFAPETGKEIWSFATKNRVDCSPVIVGERVLVAAADGRVYLLNLTTGQEVWSYECQGSINGGIAVAAGKFVLATDRGIIYCFGTPTKNRGG